MVIDLVFFFKFEFVLVVQEEQSIVIVQEVNGRRRPPAPPRIRDKSPFIRKLRRKSGKKPLPVKIITKYKNRSICHAKRVEEHMWLIGHLNLYEMQQSWELTFFKLYHHMNKKWGIKIFFTFAVLRNCIFKIFT